METNKKIYVFLIVVTTVVVCIYAQSIILPFILAILFWFLIRVMKKILAKVKFVGRAPQWLLTVFSTLLLIGFLVLAVSMISNNISELSKALPKYEANVKQVTNSINERFDIDLKNLLGDYSEDINFGSILSSIFSTLTGLFGNAFTVLLYLVFLLLEEPIFPKKLRAMYPDQKRYKHVTDLVNKIDHSIGNYVALKTLTSLMTGFLSYFALYFIGIDAPIFWAFLIFVLNFIPTIGSLIATLFPTLFAVLQFGDLTPGILVLAIVGVIQMIIGNAVEPRLMGNSLNISPLVVFLTLAAWGAIWGISGMLLSVPITVILILIMSEFPGTQPIAILLSQRGNINTEQKD
ncbi:AI-2E family transporter [Maribellus mangrovi]|uniref:AI-2E family transporter n=1 Tax=Maribellus mangrovi TaxID=3133146 RepID=UPI0030EDEA44